MAAARQPGPGSRSPASLAERPGAQGQQEAAEDGDQLEGDVVGDDGVEEDRDQAGQREVEGVEGEPVVPARVPSGHPAVGEQVRLEERRQRDVGTRVATRRRRVRGTAGPGASGSAPRRRPRGWPPRSPTAATPSGGSSGPTTAHGPDGGPPRYPGTPSGARAGRRACDRSIVDGGGAVGVAGLPRRHVSPAPGRRPGPAARRRSAPAALNDGVGHDVHPEAARPVGDGAEDHAEHGQSEQLQRLGVRQPEEHAADHDGQAGPDPAGPSGRTAGPAPAAARPGRTAPRRTAPRPPWPRTMSQ